MYKSRPVILLCQSSSCLPLLDWISSYLSDRLQCVSIDGSLSKLQHVQHEVPQGSILGPLLYILFTNELPEVIHSQCPGSPHQGAESWPNFTMFCKTCGSIGCYTDDTTYTCSGSDSIELSGLLSDKYKVMSDFLVSNKLKLNDDKTHLMVMSTSQARARRKGTSKDSTKVVIRTPLKEIEPSETEKLLGCWLHQDMKFKENILEHSESLLRSLNTRIGALKILGTVANFKTRKMIGNGIFMSKLIYLIPLWGGSSKYLLNSLQKAQNRAARALTRLDWYTPAAVLLNQCGWLSVHQLVVYHSVVLVYKIILTESPMYLHSMFTSKYTYKTKHSQEGLLRHTRNFRLDITESSFRWRAAYSFNGLPLYIRSLETLEGFKTAARSWIKENTPFE